MKIFTEILKATLLSFMVSYFSFIVQTYEKFCYINSSSRGSWVVALKLPVLHTSGATVSIYTQFRFELIRSQEFSSSRLIFIMSNEH